MRWSSIAAVLILLWTGQHWARQAVVQSWQGRHDNDFKHLYLGAVLLANGEDPYDRPTMQRAARAFRIDAINPYVYLPFTAQMMRPLTWFSLEAAARIWWFVNHVCVLGAMALLYTMRPGWRPPPLAAALGLAVTLSSFALYRTLTSGQLNAVLLLCWVGVAWLLVRRRDVAAGSLAAWAALFKLAPGILIVLFLGLRRWRAAGAMVAAGLVMAVIGIIDSGPAQWFAFIPTLRDMGYGKSTWPEVFAFYKEPSNQSLNALFHHLMVHDGVNIPWLDWGPRAANRATLIVTFAMVIVPLLLLAEKRWKSACDPEREPGRDADRLAVVLLASLLIPSLCWDHYMIIASGALLIVMWSPQVATSPWRLAVCTAIGAWWAVPWAFTAEVFVLGGGAWPPGVVSSMIPETQIPARRGVGLLLQSFKLWPLLVLWGWLLVAEWRNGPAGSRGENQ